MDELLHREGDFQDFDFLMYKIGKEHKEGKTLQELAVEHRRPVKTIEEMVAAYNNLYN